MKLNDPALISNPYPLYEQWREERPIWWSDGQMKGWILSRYEDVRAVLKDSEQS
jgi:cytochrome P450